MKKQLLLVAFLINFGLQGSMDGIKKDSLLVALEQARGDFIVHRCDHTQDGMAITSMGAITCLRLNSTEKLIDYVIAGNNSYETEDGKNTVKNQLSINTIAKKDFYGTCNKRGIIVYNIDRESTKSAKTCIEEIDALKTTWTVVVNINNTKMNADLKHYLSNRRAIILGDEPKNSYFGTIFLLGGVAVLCALLYYKFGIVKR